MNDLSLVRWLVRALINAGWAPLGVAIVYLVLVTFGLAERFDHLVHFLGGTSIAYFFYELIRLLPGDAGKIPKWINYLLALTSASTVALLWELAEFVSSRTSDAGETMLDLVFGVLGASTILVAIAAFRAVFSSAIPGRNSTPDR